MVESLAMLKNIFSDPKRMVLIVGGCIAFIFFCLFSTTFVGWAIFRTHETPEPTTEPISIGYCGVQLTSLCVTSFSQDVFGNTVINLFVPIRRFSTFYLNALSPSDKKRYDCEWEKRDPTKVHCTGPSIGLGEGFELQVFSVKDDVLIASGPFTLTAYLVTTQTADEEPTASDTPKLDSTQEIITTSPPTLPSPEETIETPTTLTPEETESSP